MKKILLVGNYPGFVFTELSRKAEVVQRKEASGEELGKLIGNVDILIVKTKTMVDRSIIDKARKLKLVITATHGFEHIDTEELRKRGIRYLTTPGGTYAVAEMAFLLMLSLYRKITKLDRETRKGTWETGPGRELYGKTLGVVGLGPIGRDVCRIGKAFGMKVIAYDPNHPSLRKTLRGKGISGIKILGLEKLLQRSDILSLHAHLNESTRHMIGKEQLDKMKPGSVIINTARGGLIDQKALYQALKEGKLAGAGLDVFEEEPLKNDPMAGLENVVLTPHKASHTEESIERIGRLVVRNALKFLK